MPQYVVCSRRRYACLLVLLPTIACTFIVSVLLCQHLVQHPLQCLHIESTRLIHDASFLVPPDDASNLVRVYVQDLPPALFNLTDWDAEPFYTKHLAAPLGGPVNGTDLSLLNTSQNALGVCGILMSHILFVAVGLLVCTVPCMCGTQMCIITLVILNLCIVTHVYYCFHYLFLPQRHIFGPSCSLPPCVWIWNPKQTSPLFPAPLHCINMHSTEVQTGARKHAQTCVHAYQQVQLQHLRHHVHSTWGRHNIYR